MQDYLFYAEIHIIIVVDVMGESGRHNAMRLCCEGNEWRLDAKQLLSPDVITSFASRS